MMTGRLSGTYVEFSIMAPEIQCCFICLYIT